MQKNKNKNKNKKINLNDYKANGKQWWQQTFNGSSRKI